MKIFINQLNEINEMSELRKSFRHVKFDLPLNANNDVAISKMF